LQLILGVERGGAAGTGEEKEGEGVLVEKKAVLEAFSRVVMM
jgi:hypothetical protein